MPRVQPAILWHCPAAPGSQDQSFLFRKGIPSSPNSQSPPARGWQEEKQSVLLLPSCSLSHLPESSVRGMDSREPDRFIRILVSRCCLFSSRGISWCPSAPVIPQCSAQPSARNGSLHLLHFFHTLFLRPYAPLTATPSITLPLVLSPKGLATTAGCAARGLVCSSRRSAALAAETSAPVRRRWGRGICE